ncbi:MAG: anhydro-N-acetylmuramic acid kinase [Pseudomonadota bacterium]
MHERRQSNGGRTFRAIGTMTGTSMDGLDLALLITDGDGAVTPGPTASHPFSALERDLLAAAIVEASTVSDREARPPALARAEAFISQVHATAISAFLAANNLAAAEIDVVGMHGQTVIHRPHEALTIQLGDGAALADALAIPVVHDFRAADVAAGGEGAPFAPAYHRALANRMPGWPVAFLNIGGVANITWIARDGAMLAFDTGPGNALIDDFVRAHSNAIQDENGAYATAGQVDAAALNRLLRHPFFAAPAPKSLDRNAFDPAAVDGLSLQDGCATLTAFTAETIARAREILPEAPGVWVVCGGGRKNRALMTALAERVEGLVIPAEAAGLHGDMLEAQAFAYLAVRSMRGLPLSFPETTGVSAPMTGGVLSRPRAE